MVLKQLIFINFSQKWVVLDKSFFFKKRTTNKYKKRKHPVVQQCFVKFCAKFRGKPESHSGADGRGTWQPSIFTYFASSSQSKFSWHSSFNLARTTCFFYWCYIFRFVIFLYWKYQYRMKTYVKLVLHYLFNWIRFLEIKKLCNVIAENLTFSKNRKLISISWEVWTCSNFSFNWKWKLMNRIRHGRKNVVGKEKFELIWKRIYLCKSNQFACY